MRVNPLHGNRHGSDAKQMDDTTPLVLVVDDVVAIVEELVTLLSLQAIPAIGAHGLQEAVALLEREPTLRIVACDVRLGRESGPDIIEQVRNNPRLNERDLQYVFVTGDPMTIDRIASLPGSSVLTKPIQPNALIALFRELLGRKA